MRRRLKASPVRERRVDNARVIGLRSPTVGVRNGAFPCPAAGDPDGQVRYHAAMTLAEVDAFARKHGVGLLLQFGSTVSGHTHARSDVDLAVLLDRLPASFADHGELMADLQRFFPGREVDLAVINQADPLLLKQIVEGCRLLYGPPLALSELKIYAFKRYQDHRRFLAMEREYVRRKVQVER